MKDVILFDLDGTLIEPAEGITNSVAYALRHFGITVADRRELYPFIGPSLWDSFSRFYGFDAGQADTAVKKYREYFGEKGVFENTLYPGIAEMLAALKRSGRRMALATTKPTVYAKQILAYHGIDSYFDFVSGSELSGARSDKAELIPYALENMSVTDKSRVIMVGDRVFDMAGALAAGVASIGVLYGHGTREEMQDATYIVASVEALGKLLLSL